jgi:hypothetical protein
MSFYLDSRIIYPLQLVLSFGTYALLWAWLAAPYLRTRPVQEQLVWLTIPLLFQFVGLTTLVASVLNHVDLGFGWMVSAANLVTIPLCIAFWFALRKRSSSALALGWILTVVGFACGAGTAYFGIVKDVFDKLGPHWYVGILYVPLQATCHVLILSTLVNRGHELRNPSRFAMENA